MSQHTPTPWEMREGTNGKWIIWDNHCRLVAALPPVSKEDDLRDGAPTHPETKKANAEFIVRAVNNYSTFLDALTRISKGKADGLDGARDAMVLERAIKIAQDAIDKAERK